MNEVSRRLKMSVPATLVVMGFGAGAGAQEIPLSECANVVGTYLTTNYGQDQSAKFLSRSLISLIEGGHAFLTDSGEGGGPGFAPFSDARGTWHCVSNENGAVNIAATVLDFTFITPDHPDQFIGRLDIDGSFEAAGGKLSGRMTLYLVPIDGDPLKQSDLKEAAGGSFQASKVVVP